MITKERLSRWVMYFGIFGVGGGLVSGAPLSALLGAALVAQYCALTAYSGYQEARE